MSGVAGPLRHPDCTTPEACRIAHHGASRTLMAWTPVYDGDGKLIGGDPNTLTETMTCKTCRRCWQRVTKSGVVSYRTRDDGT